MDAASQSMSMTAATQNPLSDLSHPGPTFSYAQAAKGRSPSGPSSISTEKASKEDEGSGSKKASTNDRLDGRPAPDVRSTKRAASEGRQPYNDKDSLSETKSLLQQISNPSTTSAAATPATQASTQSNVVVSTPSSPEFGVTSASTLPKDDDMFSNANASSDSTWEKLSQGSQNGSRSHDKTDNPKDPVESTTWDESSPASSGLKDAPPPAVNFWTQRIEAKAAKQPSHGNSVGHADTSGAAKPFDIAAESRKQGSRKQAKRTFGGLDEKPATAGAKAGMASFDGWPKDEVTGTRPQRVDKLNTTDRSLSSSITPLPPPGDSRSWPTVDSAQDEDKKKAHERAEKAEKEKAPATKSHKEKWVPVPYVPTVQFNTPLPPTVRRGARAPRGGRDAGSRIVSSSSDKPRAASPDATPGSQPPTSDGCKAEAVTPRGSSTNARPKRASSTGPASSREQRRGNEAAGLEKRNDHAKSSHATNIPNGLSIAEGRRTSATTHDEFTRSREYASSSVARESQTSNSADPRNQAGIRDREEGAFETHAHPRSAGFERRAEGSFRSYDPPRDYHKSLPLRERGRGGYRSRGAGNHSFAHANNSNGHAPPHPFVPPQMPTKSFSNHERHASQTQNGHYQSSRHIRNGSRSHSITHPSPSSRQYYFSVDNLCKDLYLRKHMDSQGFVFLSVLAKFNRIRQLTQDLDLIRYVCLHSPDIEFRTGSDGYDRLRKREGWEQWVLTLGDRDPSVQNDGPSQMQQPMFAPQPFHGAPYGMDDRQIASPRSASNNVYHASDASSMTYMPPSPSRPTTNGHDDQALNAEAPISDAVSNFTPSLTMTDPVLAEPYTQMESSFSDEQVDLLMVVVRKSPNQPAHISPPFHSATSRTFSNGSIDGRTIGNELAVMDESFKQLNINGEEASDVTEIRAASSSRPPLHVGSPPVFWVKDKESPIDSLPEGLIHEPYPVFRRKALQQRGMTSSGVCPSDLRLLYEFWSHVLVRNFNARMYHEFRQTAFDDAEKRQSTVGVEKLIQYYNESILSSKIVSDQIASDFLSLVRSESQACERPGFDRLRAAWRNGAFNIKNRNILDTLLDPSLRAEIER
ncbi:MAG: hypothetical protein Q9218_003225 [Villophora microphyllina]